MTNFDEIKTLIAPDLSRLESIIKQSLKSNSPLLEQIVDSYLQTKGKQIRPIIVILSAKFLAGKVSEDVLHGAAAVELLHNASLIHDDVIDETKKRRGRDTINSIWDNHIAVLVGDFFVSNALACAAKTNDFRVVRILSELGKELSTGELDQIDIANRHTIDEKTYYEIIRKKTASLFRSCVQIAGYAVGANEHDIDNLARFIELLGLCFQIKDDTFDYFRDDTITHRQRPAGRESDASAHLRLVQARRDETRRNATNAHDVRRAFHRTNRDAYRICETRRRHRLRLPLNGKIAKRGDGHSFRIRRQRSQIGIPCAFRIHHQAS